MVFEMHGCWASAAKDSGWVRILDRGPWIEIETPKYQETGLTPEQARYLARKLYRLARIIEKKEQA